MYEYVVCHQPRCPYENVVRKVERRRVGDGMFARVAVSCECSPDVDMKCVPAPPYEPLSVGDAFVQWVRDEGLVGSEPPC